MDIYKFIQKNNLRPSLKRHLCLLTISGIAQSYTKLMRKKFSLSYEIFAGLSEGDEITTLLNDKLIAYKAKNLIAKIIQDKNYYHNKIFLPANKIHTDILESIQEIKKYTTGCL